MSETSGALLDPRLFVGLESFVAPWSPCSGEPFFVIFDGNPLEEAIMGHDFSKVGLQRLISVVNSKTGGGSSCFRATLGYRSALPGAEAKKSRLG
jgi:hypothetical protein